MRKLSRVDIEQRLENMITTARGAGIKLTPQRLEIFRVLAGSEEHPSAESIFRAVKLRMSTVSLDTVYRTLWRLRDLGLVATLGSSSSGVRFDPNADRHHHFVCERCELVGDFESEALHLLDLPDAVKRFGSIKHAHVEVRGLCVKCQREARKR